MIYLLKNKNTLFIFSLITIVLMSLFLNYSVIFAAGGSPGTGGSPGAGGSPGSGGFSNPLGTTSIFELLKRIIGYLITIGAPIVVIMVLYGGFLILTAGDSPEKVQGGRKTIQWAAIGYAIILCSWGIIYIIGEILGTNLVR